MPQYVVMFPDDDEAAWESKTDAERQITFDNDYEFGTLLAARGGAVTGGAALVPSNQTRTLRSGEGVHAGPFRQSAGQLSGFFLVTCSDEETLLEVAEVLTRTHPVVEIRPVHEF